MPFGISSAPEVFQKIMCDLLRDLDGVEVSMDGILIHGEDKKRLDELTQIVMQKLKKAGLKLNGEKCVFGITRVTFLGHILTDKGLEIDDSNTETQEAYKRQAAETIIGHGELFG
jgi:Reverse transcriptase (RNA-dependent DNA polymerase)